MSGKTMTLIGILAFVTLVLGSFIWFIASWDKSEEEPVTRAFPAMKEERRV